uniref:Uncharacterized protein n=1 Tax=Arundo donax TaxID=35708 RepID=A0A0A9C8X1_ARUDO
MATSCCMLLACNIHIMICMTLCMQLCTDL